MATPAHDDDETAELAGAGENQLLKLGLELGPLLLFFAVYATVGIYVATGVLMVTTVLAIGVTYWLTRKVSAMPLITCAMVMVFGGLTLVLHDATFIKMKPTIVYLLFAGVLGAGYLLDRPFLQVMFGTVMHLDAAGWRKLTLRWALFFAAMAVLNEVVWRNFSTEVWVSFKVFGFLPLTFAFALAQTWTIRAHAVEPGADEPETARPGRDSTA